MARKPAGRAGLCRVFPNTVRTPLGRLAGNHAEPCNGSCDPSIRAAFPQGRMTMASASVEIPAPPILSAVLNLKPALYPKGAA